MDAAIWGLLGTIVGAAASIATTWLTGRSAAALQQAKLREERAERANAFQRQTLLELQDATHDLLRLINRAYIEDLKADQSSQQWGREMLSEEVDEGIRLAQRRVFILVERVSNDDARSNVKNLVHNATCLLFSRSKQESHHLLTQVAEEAVLVFDLLGKVLRRHY